MGDSILIAHNRTIECRMTLIMKKWKCDVESFFQLEKMTPGVMCSLGLLRFILALCSSFLLFVHCVASQLPEGIYLLRPTEYLRLHTDVNLNCVLFDTHTHQWKLLSFHCMSIQSPLLCRDALVEKLQEWAEHLPSLCRHPRRGWSQDPCDWRGTRRGLFNAETAIRRRPLSQDYPSNTYKRRLLGWLRRDSWNQKNEKTMRKLNNFRTVQGHSKPDVSHTSEFSSDSNASPHHGTFNFIQMLPYYM